MTSQLDIAKSKMQESAKRVMQMDAPRDLDGAWKSVAMQFSEPFVLENYSALQNAFDSGLSGNIAAKAIHTAKVS